MYFIVFQTKFLCIYHVNLNQRDDTEKSKDDI